MRTVLLSIFLVTGCSSSDGGSATDAATDSTSDASLVCADTGGVACCCDHDVVEDLVCGATGWMCPTLTLHTGSDCLMASSGPCALTGSFDVDSGISDAATDSGCPAGQHEIFEGPGCDGTNRHCVIDMGVDACTAVVFFCGCDGVSKTGICGSTAQAFPYRSEGMCPTDASTD
ncbi:MAG: hypothetical protein ACXVEF_16270 [Polyangiales bacterium]